MTPDDFVRTLRLVAFEPAVQGKISDLHEPPGRQPWESLVTTSRWFNELPAKDRGYLEWTLRVAAYSAIFSVLAALDGSRAIDDPPHGELRLTYVGADGGEVRLNQPEIEELHGLWTNEVFPFAEDLPGDDADQ